MYSVVLMAAMTAGGSAPAFFHCHSCCGVAIHSCYGGCNGCYGCYGSTYGCYGSCYGSGYGCYGSCYGSGYGCYGSCYGSYGGYYGSCYGSYGACNGCYGNGYSPYTPVYPAGSPVAPVEVIPAPKKDHTSLGQARLIVDLPSDATLYIDDQPMKTTSTHRTFKTPKLEKGEAYYYILRAEMVRDGRSISETKKVVVHAGDEIKATFPELSAVKTAKAESVSGQ